MEHRAEQLQARIDGLMEEIGPGISLRVGQFQTEKEQQDAQPDMESMSPELKRKYAQVFHMKAEIEDIKSLGAWADYAKEFHGKTAEAFRVLRDRFRNEAVH